MDGKYKDKDKQSPQKETSRILVEFLQVAITSIVFLKGIYPSGAFERRRYMNLVVHRARHPQLNQYIHHTLTTLLPYIQQGLVERVGVSFFNNDSIPVERFMFTINVNQSYGAMVDDADLEFSLRSFLVKLSVSEPRSKAISRGAGFTYTSWIVKRFWYLLNTSITDCRWEITVYFRALPTSDDADIWIPTGMQQWQQPPLITPIKSLNSELLSVQLYLEHPSGLEPKP